MTGLYPEPEDIERLLDRAGPDRPPRPDGLPPWGPPPPADIPDRVIEMYAMRRMGHTLQQIGDHYGITRERVRQLIGRQGLPARVAPGPEERALARARGRSDEIADLYRELGNVAHVAARTGLNRGAVGRVVSDEVTDRPAYARKPERDPRYSDDELVDLLGRVAREAGTECPSVREYRAHAAGRFLPDGRPWPGPQTYLVRFETWVEARRRAGLEPGRTGGPPRRYDADDCVRAVATLWRQLGRAPTVAEYEEFSRGRSHIPSVAIVRRRIGGGWRAILATARPHLAGPSGKRPRRQG